MGSGEVIRLRAELYELRAKMAAGVNGAVGSPRGACVYGGNSRLMIDVEPRAVLLRSTSNVEREKYENCLII